ncbi:MAG: HD domain-containing protein [Candidatus Hydrogenedentota bacterium]|nr:MAG: HD domain-containing protein [Candidatus Hydrogenedentota bacterium]
MTRSYEEQRAALLAEMATLFEFFNYDVDAVLERCLEAARNIRDFDEYALALLQPSDEIELKVSSGLAIPPGSLNLEDFYPRNSEEYIVSEVVEETANVIFPPGGPIRSYILVPLITHNDVVGLFMLGSRFPQHFSEQHRDLFFSLGSHLAVALDSIRHYKQSEQRLAVLVGLQRSFRALSSRGDLDKILEGIAGEGVKLRGLTSIAIYLFDSARGCWSRVVFRSSMPSVPPPGVITRQSMPERIERILADGETGAIDREDFSLVRPIVCSPRCYELVVIPLRAQEKQTMGFILMENAARDPDQERFIGLFSHQVRALFANAMLIRGLQQKTDELERSHKLIREYADSLQRSHEQLENRLNEVSTLLEVSNVLGTSTDLDETLGLIVEKACGVMRADKGSLLMLDGDVLTARCTRGIPAGKIIQFRIGEGIAGMVAKTGHSRIVENIREEDAFVVRRGEDVGRDETLLAVPLKIKERIIGVLNVERDVKFGVFTREDESLLKGLAGSAAQAIEKAKHFEELRELNRQTLEAFAQAVDTKDAYTHGHSRRVSRLSMALARKLRLSPKEVEVIERAALLHDIGKIGITNAILFKPGKLTPEEYETMKGHVIFGENILKPIRMLREEAVLVRHHHERWDGKGYPDGLKGEEIPIGSAIIAVADAYDTMTSDRPYRKSIGRKGAMAELKKCSGTQFHPLVVGALEMILGFDASGEEFDEKPEGEDGETPVSVTGRF